MSWLSHYLGFKLHFLWSPITWQSHMTETYDYTTTQRKPSPCFSSNLRPTIVAEFVQMNLKRCFLHHKSIDLILQITVIHTTFINALSNYHMQLELWLVKCCLLNPKCLQRQPSWLSTRGREMGGSRPRGAFSAQMENFLPQFSTVLFTRFYL